MDPAPPQPSVMTGAVEPEGSAPNAIPDWLGDLTPLTLKVHIYKMGIIALLGWPLIRGPQNPGITLQNILDVEESL